MDTGHMIEVESEEVLRDLLGPVMPRAATKVKPSLHQVTRDWLARSPFCLISTSAPDGSCDVSPKGDPAGFTLVLDDTTIAIPDRAGNRRADGFLNLLGNPQIGLIYLVPGRGDTLRINGRARIVSEAPFFDQMIVAGNRPRLAVVVDVQEVFFHCSKAFLRSKLWDPQTWEPDALPSRAQISHQLQPGKESLQQLEEYYGSRYADGLYPA
jgi:PPOX class probable FMN-dependent enzyme